jgi:hypothetical protein
MAATQGHSRRLVKVLKRYKNSGTCINVPCAGLRSTVSYYNIPRLVLCSSLERSGERGDGEAGRQGGGGQEEGGGAGGQAAGRGARGVGGRGDRGKG